MSLGPLGEARMSPSPLNKYRVKVGHVEIAVEAATREEAIVLARRRLAEEHPRLYDVIRALAPTRFEVRPAA